VIVAAEGKVSEWEDFCEHMGVNPGCPEDYDRLMDMVEKGGRRKCYNTATDCAEDESEELIELRFSTFREAAEWAKRKKGRSFTRSADGNYFVAKGGGSRCARKGRCASVLQGRLPTSGVQMDTRNFPRDSRR